MQLYMQPAGPVLQGDTVNVICRVTDKHLLDIVRLVRYPLNNDTRHSDVITTNGVIEGLFKVMSRYKVVEWNESRGLMSRRYKVVEWNESRGLIELQIASETPCTLNTL